MKKGDVELWNKFKTGDRPSFEHIYRLHFKNLKDYGLRISKDSMLIEDAIQELFVEIWHSKERLGGTNNIKAYLMLSFKRKLMKAIKKQRTTISNYELSDNDFEIEQNIEDRLTHSEKQKEQHKRLNEAMKKLSVRQKEIIYLKFFQKLEYEDIVEIMDISYQSARNLLNKSIKNLGGNLTVIQIFIAYYWLQN